MTSVNRLPLFTKKRYNIVVSILLDEFIKISLAPKFLYFPIQIIRLILI
jgi:hypothetical protein